MKLSLLSSYLKNFIEHLKDDYDGEDMHLVVQDDNGDLYESVFMAFAVVSEDSDNSNKACFRCIKGNKVGHVSLIEKEYASSKH
jgi:hypothetical protein